MKKIVTVLLIVLCLFSFSACFEKDYTLTDSSNKYASCAKSEPEIFKDNGYYNISYIDTLYNIVITNGGNAYKKFNVLKYDKYYGLNHTLSSSQDYFMLLSMSNIFYNIKSVNISYFTEEIPQEDLNQLYASEQNVEAKVKNLKKFKSALENLCKSTEDITGDFNVDKALQKYIGAYKELIGASFEFNFKFAEIYMNYFPFASAETFKDSDVHTLLLYQVLINSYTLFQSYINSTTETTIFIDSSTATLKNLTMSLFNSIADSEVSDWATNNQSAGVMSTDNHSNLTLYYTTLVARSENYPVISNILKDCANVRRTSRNEDEVKKYKEISDKKESEILTTANIAVQMVKCYA